MILKGIWATGKKPVNWNKIKEINQEPRETLLHSWSFSESIEPLTQDIGRECSDYLVFNNQYIEEETSETEKGPHTSLPTDCYPLVSTGQYRNLH